MSNLAHARALRLPEVCARVGMSRAWIYDAIARGDFPAQIKTGSRASAWIDSEIDAWLLSRTVQRPDVGA